MVSSLLIMSLTGCFTGIESTPKITAKDVKREKIPVKPESSYMNDIKPEPFLQWKPGKAFYVSDNMFKELLQPFAGLENMNLKGKIIAYDSFREVRDVTGAEVMELTFTSPEGHKLVYRSNQVLSNMEKDKDLRIPFLVEMSLVDSVKAKLKGNTYYVITSSWYDTANQSLTGRKFIPVTVTDVLPGNSFYSTILSLKDETGKDFRLYLSIGSDLKSLRQFDSLFSLKNPRESYPLISDAVWQNIVKGKVATGMTKNECRLALGSPKTVNEQYGYSALREIWSYENGIYLIFEDGILNTYRQ